MPHTTGPPLTGWEQEVKMIAIPLYSITMFLSLVGNILVIYVLYKRPETRRLTSFMYVNLAVADLLVTTVVMPESLTVILTDEKWISELIGELLFKFVIFTLYVSITASVFLLSAIAFDCFNSITRPMQIIWYGYSILHVKTGTYLCFYVHLADLSSVRYKNST